MSGPIFYDKTALENLKRKDLVFLAKSEGIKANGKSSDMISKLLEKYPGGVPKSSPTNNLKRKSVEIKAEGDLIGDSVDAESSKKRRKIGDHSHRRNPTPRPRGESLQGLVSDSPVDLTSMRQATPQPEPVHGASQTATSVRSVRRPRRAGPGNKDIRYVRRELVKPIDELAKTAQRIEETESSLADGMDLLRDMSGCVEKLFWIGRSIEVNLIEKMKLDRSLVDGTAFMTRPNRRNWRQFLKDLDKDSEALQFPSLFR